MDEKYAILDEAGGWLINLIVWDGDLAKWSPEPGTIAVPISEVDFSSLPERPTES